MKILLAGYNLDTDVVHDLLKNNPARADVTPETISAAYARISRDSRPIDDLRRIARTEIEHARKSNRTIIFKMGHHSVAEHAVFNFDILGVSRLALEELEKFRLCSYTEKSQRYVTLNSDFIIPPEIKLSIHVREFTETIRLQNEFYKKCYEQLRSYWITKFPDRATDAKQVTLLEGAAKEDARYITALAMTGQVGETLNARNLELLIRRFSSHPLKEIQEIGRKMYGLVEDVAPSVVVFVAANAYDQKTYPELQTFTEVVFKEHQIFPESYPGDVSLVDYTFHGDENLLAALLHTSGQAPYRQCLSVARMLTLQEKKNLVKTACRYMEFYDTALREFEYPACTFELTVSASCYAQLKRHRMATVTVQKYDPALGVVIPDSIVASGLDREFKEIIHRTNEVYQKIHADFPEAAQYILTNAHQRRVLLKTNARELYHISRLREDAHAQWEIRKKTTKMSELAKRVMPLTMLFMGGKDNYAKIYEQEFGHPPKATLPLTASS